MPVTVTFTTPLTNDDKLILGAIASAEEVLPATTPAVPTVNNFPLTAAGLPDIVNATMPSPENSEILILRGNVTGPPYLVDNTGGVWTLTINAAGLGVAFVDSTQICGGASGQGIDQLIVRTGLVYCMLVGGQVQLWNPSQGSLYNATLPDARTTPATATTPALPALPAIPAVMGGTSGRIIHCGIGQTLATITAGITAALAGDKVQVANGTYNEALPALGVPMMLDLGGSTLSGVGLTASLAGGGLGLIVPNAPGCIVQNGTITGVAMDQPNGQMTAAVRPNGGCSHLETNSLTCTSNQTGFASGGFPIVWIDNGSTLHNNGLGDAAGSTHNAYFSSAPGAQTTLNDTTSVIDPTASGPLGLLQGHAIKCRQEHGMIVSGGTYAASEASIFDFPDGSSTPIQLNGATLKKTAADSNHAVLGYAMESQKNGLAGVIIHGGTVNALCASPLWQGTGGTITIDASVVLSGNPVSAAGITVA